MKAIDKLLSQITLEGFNGTFPLYVEKEGRWHDAYALFCLEFQEREPDISEEFALFLEEKFKDCLINVRGTQFEVIGHDFDEVDDFYYDYYLIDELW